jgi:asparagine synthase (glutamine-hydrolysing)
MGFAIPLGNWLRGPIRDWAEELLKESLLDQQGFLAPKPIRKIWSEHVSRRKDHSYLLWDVLMFQAWLSEHNAR